MPVAAADSGFGGALECEGSAVQRAVCAAKETIAELTGAADPLVDYAGEEARWAIGTTCDVVEHVIGGTCAAIATDQVVLS